MAEYIEKEKLLEELREKQLVLEQNGYYDEANSFLAMREVYIGKLPTIDMVTCKDCKYRGEGYIHSTKWLPCMDVETNNDWFCADGERRTE